jgi:hypothetical protein
MCLLIVEIAMLIAGIMALVTGKLPSGLFRVLFGKGEYRTEAGKARLFGLLLAAPLPLAFLGGVVIALLFGEEGSPYATTFELLVLVVVGFAASVIARRMRQPAA